MKKMGIFGVVVLLLAVGLQGWGLSICEYRSPKTALTDARLTFGYRYYDDANTVGVDVNSGRLAFDYDQLFDSPNYGFSLTGAVELTLDEFLPTAWLGQGAATFRYYPIEESLLFAFCTSSWMPLVGAWAAAPFLTDTKNGLFRVLMTMTAFLLLLAVWVVPPASAPGRLHPARARLAALSRATPASIVVL